MSMLDTLFLQDRHGWPTFDIDFLDLLLSVTSVQSYSPMFERIKDSFIIKFVACVFFRPYCLFNIVHVYNVTCV